ncbi:hypothetical protein [Streptomyces sp. G1]|nr:hypothetical protein [Streptomyces sp. G1]
MAADVQEPSRRLLLYFAARAEEGAWTTAGAESDAADRLPPGAPGVS